MIAPNVKPVKAIMKLLQNEDSIMKKINIKEASQLKKIKKAWIDHF